MRLFLILFTFLISLQTEAAPVQAEHATVELVSDHRVVTPGVAFDVGLHFNLEDHWHIYYVNPGDTGIPPQARWQKPESMTLTDFQWPVPKTINTAGIVNYGYEGEVLLAAEAVLPEGTPSGAFMLKADVDFLICKDICLPGSAQVSLPLEVGDTTVKHDRWAGVFADTVTALPERLPPEAVEISADATHYMIQIPMNMSTGQNLALIPAEEGVIEDAAVQETFTTSDGNILKVMKDTYQDFGGDRLAGLLVTDSATYRIDAPITEISLPPSPMDAPASTPEQTAELSLFAALAFAFLAGLILNLMPCVLPVLALKILSLVKHAHGDHGWQHGVIFTAGVMSSLLALGGGLYALRGAGEAIGWGFQLQDPYFTSGLAILLFLLALMFFGVFEIGTSLTRVESKHKEGKLGAFLSGVLVTIVATPCTVPFMGGAVAYALTQPGGVGLGVFAMMGLGLSFPFLMASIFPQTISFLPKPGAWMVGFRQFLGFPMLVTALWLVWVFNSQAMGQQTGMAATFMVLFGLIVVAFAAWIYGKWHVLSASVLKKFVATVILLGAIAGTIYGVNVTVAPMQSDSLEWQEWSTEAVEKARAEGKTVFVNFTADWCITCKVNERVALSDASVIEAFQANDVVLFKADWTNRDAAIARELDRFGRAGVPLYLVYKDGNAAVVLPQLLSVGVVTQAVE